MKKFTVSYRDEFYAIIEAETVQEAIRKFEQGNAEYKLLGDLHNDYITVTDEDGKESYI